MSFEQVFEIFKDYMEQDKELEVVKTKKGICGSYGMTISPTVRTGISTRPRRNFLTGSWRTARVSMKTV